METKTRTLSKVEAKAILEMEWQGNKLISLRELQKTLNITPEYTAVLAHRLVEKGWLERLRAGVFRLIPADRGLEAVSDTNPFLGEEVFGHLYFYSFGTACSYYGFTEQAFTEMYVACLKARPPKLFREKNYIFVSVSERHFFGFETVTVLGENVKIASWARAVLDALDRPHFAGGVGEVSHIIKKAIPKLEWSKLLQFLKIWDESALVQRLGYFLDLHKIPIESNVRKKLKGMVHPHNKIYLGSRKDWGTAGALNSEWSLIENVPKEILIEKSEEKHITHFYQKKLP